MNRDLQVINPAVDVRPAEELPALAATANSEHDAGETATRKGLAHFRAAGEALLRAKAACSHGEFLPWLEANVRFDRMTAARYMRVAKHWDKCNTATHLADALRLLRGEKPADREEPEPLDKTTLNAIGKHALADRKAELNRLARVVEDSKARRFLVRLMKAEQAETVAAAVDKVLTAAAQSDDVAHRLGLGKPIAGKVGAVAEPDEATAAA